MGSLLNESISSCLSSISLIGAFADLSASDPDIALLEQSLRAYKMELEALALKDSHIAKYNERDITAASTTMELLRRTMASMIDLPLFLL